jgi:GNAT superfamily N-acetyltransferase
MTQSVTIRNYNHSDKEICRSLWEELTEWHRQIYKDPTIGGKNPGEHFDRYLSKVGPSKIWVATIGSEVVGMVGLDLSDYGPQIEPLIVAKTHRNKGVGTKLVEKTIAEARRNGNSLSVAPVARNIDAIGFFNKMGFKNLGQIEMFMDFRNRKWESRIEFHGCNFDF